VYSIYLGAPALGSHPIPERGSVRLRFRDTSLPAHNIYAFNLDQPVNLDVKLRPQHQQKESGKEKIRKYSVNDIPMSIALSALKDPNSFKQLDQYPNGKSARRLIE